MTVRWYLGAAFGPHEAGPQWPFVPLAVFALVLLRLGRRLW